MERIFNWSVIAMAFAAMSLMSACNDDDYDPSSFAIHLYGVGTDDVIYDVIVEAYPDGVESNRKWTDRFQRSGQGYGWCGNLPSDIEGQQPTNNNVFSLNLRCHCTYTIWVEIRGDNTKIFAAKHIGNWEAGRDIWINVSELQVETDNAN